MIPLPSLTGGRSREHSRLAKASVENIIIINIFVLSKIRVKTLSIKQLSNGKNTLDHRNTNENATSKSLSIHCETCCSHDLSACGRKRQSRKTCIVHAPLHTHQTICSNVIFLAFRYALFYSP